MTFLLLNQTFHPDRVATAQYLTDVARALVAQGHSVTVVTSARGYDDPGTAFPSRETWSGVEIHRIRPLAFGKSSRWRRAVDFMSFLVLCVVRLARLPRFDVVIALTSPPLISVLGAAIARLRGSRFVFWVMDLNPDEAIAAGWLKPRNLTARGLGRLLSFSLRHADQIVALDRFMADVIAAKGIDRARITVLPPWCHDAVRFDARGRDAFRAARGWDGRFVVMYAGNHSPCNPLDTVIEVAESLQADPGIVFCFIGGGTVFREIQRDVEPRLANVVCVPYVPRDELSAALSAADLHVVTLGDAFRGLIHPSKVYNVLKVSAPILYVGPEPSHVTDVANATGLTAWRCAHGDVSAVVAAIRAARAATSAADRFAADHPANPFDAERLLPRFVELVTASPTRSVPLLERV
jgi:glycosyltransferase involved in cell wall biosynthesis